VLPKTKYARSDDVRIAYQITGAGPFDVVWAPGTMSHLDLDWEIPQRALFFERFSKFCRLIRFDKRGTGLSDRPVKMATLEERTDDIRAVMDDIGIEHANIFGVSEGGSMACLFAATYPQRVNSLLVWGAQARWIASPDHPWGQTQEEHDRMVAMIDDDWPSFEYITGPGAGVGKDADPAFIESLSRYMRAAANPSAVHAYEQMNGQIDTRPILPSIQAPTLVMNRTGDPCTLFALVDHSGEAAKVGMKMRPTKLLIFGNPKDGTPVMLAAPTIAIDLPLKILIWEDAQGKVLVTYDSPAYLQKRHHLPPELLQNIVVVEALAKAAAE
jgi:pimeloyl-ACP methyl ester carboxylesterase